MGKRVWRKVSSDVFLPPLRYLNSFYLLGIKNRRRYSFRDPFDLLWFVMSEPLFVLVQLGDSATVSTFIYRLDERYTGFGFFFFWFGSVGQNTHDKSRNRHNRDGYLTHHSRGGTFTPTL